MPTILVSLLLGALSGVIAALCGVGGGIILVPAFVLLINKMDQKGAVATSLAAIVLTAIFASLKNSRNGFVHWNVAIPAGLAGAVVAWFAADYLKRLQNETLTKLFAIVLITVGCQMLLFPKKKENLSNEANPAISTEHKKN